MAVIKNTFSTTLDTVTTKTHNIIGLSSETSTTSLSYMTPEVSSYFLKALYQTLIDAGYNDTTMNEDDYSITVLGFKFFVLISSNSSNPSSYIFCPMIYTYGINNYMSDNLNTYIALNNTGKLNLEFNITVRGDKNFIWISYGSFYYPNYDISLFVFAKGKNLISGETNYLFGTSLGRTHKLYCRNQSELYIITDLSDLDNTSLGSNVYYNSQGYNTQSKMVLQPLLLNYGTCFYPSLIIPNNNIIGNKYYKIGSDIYFAAENVYYYISNSRLYTVSGGKCLFKVS